MSTLFLFVACFAICSLGQSENVLAGSGTTNPSRLIWKQQNLLMDRAFGNIKMSYRAVGSGTGQKEMIDGVTDFGCSEIPMSTTQQAQVGGEMLTIPFVLGSVSVFHSVPNLLGKQLNMTADVLADIFQLNITYWDASPIQALNPDQVFPHEPIKVFHRLLGSSSTFLLSQYLAFASTKWVLGVGSVLNWHPNATSVLGSAEMSSMLYTTPYSIGYLDTGFANDPYLQEIKLRNKAGNFVSSRNLDGVQAAANMAAENLPKANESWANVNLVNQDGPITWPMTTFSYFLVRRDLSLKNNSALIKAQLDFALSKDGQAMASQFGFLPIGEKTGAISKAGVARLLLAPQTQVYTFEVGTNATFGAGPYVISDRREGYLTRSVEDLGADVRALEAVSEELKLFEEVLELHGSGTTNPSDYIWKVMSLLESRLQSPSKLTYRGIGSGNGIREFLARANAFGSADIPLSAAQYASLEGEDVLQIPFTIGAVSVFHNAVNGLVLDAQTLAQIFLRNIIDWDHPSIVDLNPTLKDQLKGKAITIVHRKDVSSSTFVFTNYLKAAAPNDWVLPAGSNISWPKGDGVVPLEGSGPVATYISENKWSIGYVDSGWGAVFGLYEAKIQNKDGNFLTSSPEGILAAANQVASRGLPASHESWHSVTLVNQPGPNTWPMCAFSYIFMRADQTKAEATGALLEMFVRFLLSAEGQKISQEFAFVPPPPEVQAINRAGLSLVKLSSDVTRYEFEGADTVPIQGAQDHYVSQKRHGYLYEATTRLRTDVKHLQAELVEVQQFEEVLLLHGSGTTNPSNYIWYMMELMQARLSSASRLTYRAVGSGTGKTEFLANVNGFGCADIPLFAAEEAQVPGQMILQFPFLVGAVSVFHSGVPGLRFTPSLLARVFSTQVDKWDHPDILALNIDLADKIPKNQSIKVVHRDQGSSSTYLLTNYLKASAPADWSLGAGVTITWPNMTFSAEGSQGVSAFIQNNPWSIGYLDSGFGQDDSLAEVRLRNFNGNYVTSEDPEGILAAARQAVDAGLPESQGSWKDVSLINLPGNKTWPMCAFSYIFARADQTNTEEAGALLKAFLEFILSKEGQEAVKDFSFVPVGPEIEAINQKGIKLIQLDLAHGVVPYTFETATAPITGAGDRVISSKRSNAYQSTKAQLIHTINKLQAELKAMQAQSLESVDTEGDSDDGDNPSKTAIAAIVIAVITFFMVVIFGFEILSKLRKLEAKSKNTTDNQNLIQSVEFQTNTGRAV